MRGKPRPGQFGRFNQVFCPVARGWIGQTREQEVCGNRAFYDEADVASAVDHSALDFNDVATAGGWLLPDQLLEVVTTCEYCEVYCLGRNEGPDSIPAIRDIDRTALLRELE